LRAHKHVLVVTGLCTPTYNIFSIHYFLRTFAVLSVLSPSTSSFLSFPSHYIIHPPSTFQRLSPYTV
jgi:hypothetical protein